MHAVAWHIRERVPRRSVVYLSAETFSTVSSRRLRGQDTMSFKEQLRSVDVLMVDDVQFIAGKDATQEEFFPHLQCAGRPGQTDHHLGR